MSLVRDTDGDNYLDGAECNIGTNPNLISSKPTDAQCGPNTDVDLDKVLAGREVCFYNTDPNNNNTDGDTCRDGKEVASINGDTSVNVVDLQQVASEFNTHTLPGSAVKVNFDQNKNGQINVADLSLVASVFGNCP